LLNGNYENATLYHIRLSFSKDFNDMGAFKFYKFWALVKTIFLIWYYRFSKNITILYYAPAGPNKLAMFRDMILLSTTRILFNKLILHTHAGGTSILYKNLNFIFKYFYRLAFFKPNILIKLTEYSHGDEFVLKPIKTIIIPNGIEDNYINFKKNNLKQDNDFINLLYVGAMYKERGIIDLILALKILLDKGYKVKLNLVGIFIENIFEIQIHELINNNNLNSNIVFYGTKIENFSQEIFINSPHLVFGISTNSKLSISISSK
jgi:glycosyltransferase involved in cell wall biosynthesis